MVNDVAFNLKSLPERMVFNDSPLKYMFLGNEEYHFFQAFRFIMGQVPPEFAGSPWINLTPNAFYALYFPNGNKLSPMHVNWGNTVYPDYFDKVNHVLTEDRPIVISYDKLEVPSYGLFAKIENNKPQIFPRRPDENINSKDQLLDKKQEGNCVNWQVPASLSQRESPFSLPLFFYLPDVGR